MAPDSACAEVRVLRSFVPPWRRHKAINALVRRYASGRRDAWDVCEGLAALLGQGRVDDCGWLLMDAMDAVRPVPTVLWTWACRHADLLGFVPAQKVLRIAALSPRYERHLVAHKDALTRSVDGVVALIHEAWRFPAWAPETLRPALRRFLAVDASQP
jgi:hypothetical protein